MKFRQCSYTTVALITLVILAIGATAGHYFNLFTSIPFIGSNTSHVQKEQRPAFVPDQWKQFRNSTVGVSMYVPPNAETKIERDLAKVQVIGPLSQDNSEITDGFTLYAGRKRMESVTLRELAQKEYARNIQGPETEAVTAPKATSSPQGTMYTYITRGPMGAEVQHALFQADADTAIVTTAIVSDPQNRGYADTVRTIQRSLNVVPITAEEKRISIQERFEKKIVYTTSVGTTTAPYAAHCSALEGTFNECGSVCSADAQGCASVCALTCSFVPTQ